MVARDPRKEEQLGRAMAVDVPRLARRLRNSRDRRAQELLAASIARAEARGRRFSEIHYPPELPVSERREELCRAVTDHQVVVICGETGSGKSTQLPKLCLELGLGARGMIAHTQPRRVAARAIAARLAEELGTPLGRDVGYKVRFADRTGPDCLIKVLTDGMLLAELQADRELRQYGAVIIDEAHERSLNIDFLLGYLKRLLPRRPDLKLIITSATIDPRRFAEHFGGAPVIEVSGRTWPVDIRYRPWREDDDVRDQPTAVCEAVEELWREGPGDVLVFLPGERDIRETAEALRKRHPARAEILPLFARLSACEQQRIFAPGAAPRIVLATNVAETSLTVPRIRYVVDTGLARISRYSRRTKVQRLPVEAVSRASADQRAGRCGRTGPGICIRLYAEEDYAARPQFTDPEILRTNLASVILQMQLLGLGAVEDFPFVEAPDRRDINDGYRLLYELGAVDAERRITNAGRRMARLPVDPRFARMLLAAESNGCLAEMLVLVAGLSIQDPRERPLDSQAAADQAHAEFADPRSDFLTLLRLWEAWRERTRHLSRSKLRAWCRERFLSWNRMREWQDVHNQLAAQLKEEGAHLNQLPAGYHEVHRALLAGLLDHVGVRGEGHEYEGARGLRFHVFPGSGLFRRGPKWLMAAEMVETSRVFARCAAKIEPRWVAESAPHLVQREYSEPHWQAARLRVAAFEKTSLYGLVLVPRRRVDYARIAPREARLIFIREGLVQGDFPDPPAFLAHNLALAERIRKEEDRRRRRDLLRDEEDIVAWYAGRLPPAVVDGRTLRAWLARAGADAVRRLYMRREDVQARAADTDDEALPEALPVNGVPLRLDYRFAPGERLDGVTVEVPPAMLGQLDEERLAWLVPGLLEEKITALIRSLPKPLRRNFVPAPDHARACAQALAFGEGDLYAALSERLRRMTGVAVPRETWRPGELPPHLRMRVRVVDEAGRVLAEGEDVGALRRRFAGQAARALQAGAADAWPARRVTRWDFAAFPRELRVGGLPVYPALRERGGEVECVLYSSEAEALELSRHGLRRLCMLALPEQVRYLRRKLPELNRLELLYHGLGSAAELREDILLAVFERVLADHAELPRDRGAFERLVAELRPRLVPVGTELVALLREILELHAGLVRRLRKLRTPALLAAAQDVGGQLGRLVYAGFARHTPPARLASLPRYLRAAERRLEKLAAGNPRDEALLREIQRHECPLLDAFGDDPAAWERSPASAYRWLLEEYRVSLFAQELGTREKVSDKRLQEAWQALRRQV